MGEDDDKSESTAAVGEISAAVPLGSKFFFELKTTDASGDHSIKSGFSLSSAKITVPMKDPVFPNHVVIEYASGTQEERKRFRAVHLGTVDLMIVPSDNSGNIKVHITVIRPQHLGQDPVPGFPELDDLLIDLGHKRGIPPHFLRGQIAAEGRKDRMAYRYEPLGAGQDLRGVSCSKLTLAGCLGGGKIVTKDYSPYRLASLMPSAYPTKVYTGRSSEIQPSDVISPAGALLMDPADVQPRNAYSYFISRKKTPTTDPVREKLPPSDTPPMYASIRELVETNPKLNWFKLTPRKVKDIIDCEPTVMDTTAQTPVAASYGLFQMLYTTAIGMGWEGVDGKKNPNYLFDTNDNLAKGGGTIALAGAYLRYLFGRVNPPDTLTNPSFQDDGQLRQAFGFTFTAFNQGPPQKRKKPAVTEYWTKVFNEAKGHQPVPMDRIF